MEYIVKALVLAAALIPSFVAAQTESTTPPGRTQIGRGADPWLIERDGKFYWSQSDNNRGEIVVWESDSPDSRGVRRAVWKAPRRGPFSRELWAPEIHFIDGRFYIIFAADNGENRNHRTYVLVSETDDPFGKYALEGPLYTGDSPDDAASNRWAIDATIFRYREKMYLIWSGWEDDRDVQFLYIAPFALDPPRTLGPRVKICNNADYLWERVEERRGTRGLNEGPEILTTPSGRVFLTYSCGASWLPTYKVGALELVGDDPLDPSAWKKGAEPLFQGSGEEYGVGHGTFLQLSDGSWRYYYHAKTNRDGGWGDRTIFWREATFDESGAPKIM
ncbi:MAG: glycoside hydrolase family 43 protein [Thermoguttaceae bacterium]|nr:glycoside hydrolase family 43 protein [Thermoguttaceae bacterium]